MQAEVISWLNTLKEMGVSLAVDDFGTGFSGLSYLKKLPVDIIKIDNSFIRDIASDPNDAAIIITIISIAHSLKLSVTAAGMGTSQQFEFLRLNGCDYVQGYMFSHPLPAEDHTVLL